MRVIQPESGVEPLPRLRQEALDDSGGLPFKQHRDHGLRDGLPSNQPPHLPPATLIGADHIVRIDLHRFSATWAEKVIPLLILVVVDELESQPLLFIQDEPGLERFSSL